MTVGLKLWHEIYSLTLSVAEGCKYYLLITILFVIFKPKKL